MCIWTNINHYVVFLVQRQQFWHIIFWWGLTITKDFQDSVFAYESSLPYSNHSGIACMTNIVIVKLQKISLSKPNVKLPVGIPLLLQQLSIVSVEPKFLLLHMSCAILEISFYFVLLDVLIKYLDLKVLNKRESTHSYLFT